MASGIDESTIKHIAKLAHLAVSQDEIHSYQSQLGKILDYIDELSSVDVSNVPLVLSAGTPEREDVSTPSLDVERIMSQAPTRLGTAFQVPRIIETEV